MVYAPVLVFVQLDFGPEHHSMLQPPSSCSCEGSHDYGLQHTPQTAQMCIESLLSGKMQFRCNVALLCLLFLECRNMMFHHGRHVVPVCAFEPT